MGNSGGDGGERDGQGVGVGQSGNGGIWGDLKSRTLIMCINLCNIIKIHIR